MKIKIYNQNGEVIREEEFSDAVFNCVVKPGLIHQALITQMNNERQVLAHVKTKSEVRGGGKKPWKQKGPGRARVGSNRSPLWRGGGVTFGPRNDRNFSQKINKKMKKAALCAVLSDKLAHNAFVIFENFELPVTKTKEFKKIVASLQDKILKSEKKYKDNFLFLMNSKDEVAKRSGRNLANVEILNRENINIVDLLKRKFIATTISEAREIEKAYIVQ